MLKGYFILLFIVVCFTFSYGQNASLARRYYNDGEFEKAATIYKVLHEKNRGTDYYFERYLNCLMEMQAYRKAEAMVKKSIKASPDKPERYVSYGLLMDVQGRQDKATNQYERAVKNMQNNQMGVLKLAQAFINLKKYDFAIKAYKKGEKIVGVKYVFAFEIGNVYRLKGTMQGMIDAYLNSLQYMPNRISSVQAYFQSELSEREDGYKTLKKLLVARIQKEPEESIYAEFLIWVYVQQNKFGLALRQAKALDRRLDENGERIFSLAQIAIDEKDYITGIESYTYIVAEKGLDSPYYIDSKQRILSARREQLLAGFQYTPADLDTLEKSYLAYLQEFGKTASTASIMQDLASFYVKYLHKTAPAIDLMNELIVLPRLHRIVKNNAKLELGDYYLTAGEVWEATLLYSQVDKEMRNAPLGEVARFKNAELSYYKGDFDWAKDQLDILKGSTSDRISNDAIDLSVFIMEHYNLDTTARPMELFARAGLLNFQNKHAEAFTVLDSLGSQYSDHGLNDDILFTKAKVYMSKLDFEAAGKMYLKITEAYKDGILVDNALFRLAELNEKQFKNPAKAMEYYQQILFDHPGSLFTVQARKRYRKLRGDNVQ